MRTPLEDHFVDVTDMIEIGKGDQRQADDVRLSRYACYLVVQNGDPTKLCFLLEEMKRALRDLDGPQIHSTHGR